MSEKLVAINQMLINDTDKLLANTDSSALQTKRENKADYQQDYTQGQPILDKAINENYKDRFERLKNHNQKRNN